MAINQLTRRGLVSYWDIGNKLSYSGSGTTVKDLIGSNDLTLNNSPTYSSSNWGGLTFSGSTQYATTPSTSASNVYNPRTNNFSFGCMFKTSASQPNIFGALINRVASSFWEIYILASNSNGYAITYDGSNQSTNTYSAALNDGNFHTLTLTRNGTTFKLYVDGILYQTVTAAVSDINITSGTPLYIANSAAGRAYNGNFYIGYYYNVELTAQEVLINNQYLKKRTLH